MKNIPDTQTVQADFDRIALLSEDKWKKYLVKIKKMLKVNGTLVVLDLFQQEGSADSLRSLVAIPIYMILNIVKNGRVQPSREKREVWDEHVKRDVYSKVLQVREICTAILPEAKVQMHLFWRYSIVWNKSETAISGG